MARSYKQKCGRCKKNYVVISWRQEFPICFDCQKADLNKEITDPQMRKFFDIPDELYRKSSFLRSIKLNYLKYSNLTEKQREAFVRVASELQDPKSSQALPEKEIS